MAGNEQKIDEIISEAAFKQLDKLYSDLAKASEQYSKFGNSILEVNKEIAGSKSFSDLEKSLEKQKLSEERLAKAKADRLTSEQRLAQAQQRTIEQAEKRAKAEANAQAKAEAAIKSKEAAEKRMNESAKKGSDSEYKANMKVATSQKDIERGLKSNAAAAISATGNIKKNNEDASKSFKSQATFIKESNDSLKSYGVTVNNLISEGLSLRSQLKAQADEFKALDKATPKQLSEFTLSQQQLKIAISQNATETKRLIREQTSAEGSSDRLEARLLTLRATYKSLSKEEKETSDEAKALAAEISRLDVEVKKNNENLGVFNDSVGNYGKALEGLEDPLNTLNPAMGGFVSQIKNAITAGRAFIATPVGAVIAAIAAALGGLKMWYDYNKGLEEATRLTRQFTGLTGDDLKSLRSEVEATASVYNKDFKEVLEAVNATANNFGISFQESMNLVKDGFLSGADASGDFLSQLKEYPTQLQAVGLNAEQTIALISQNVKDGIFSDKGIDSIKEGGIRLREMTKATSEALDGIGLNSKQISKELETGQSTIFDVIQQVSGKLAELPPQSAVVGTAIADIFGGAGEDAGLRYLSTLKDINLSLSDQVAEQGELAQAQQLQLEATEELKKVTAELFDSTGGGFELLIANAKLYGTNLLIQIINGTRDLYNWFVDLYNSSIVFRGSIQTIGLAFSQVNSVAKLLFNYLYTNLKAIGGVIGAVLSGEFSSIGDILDKNGRENEALFANFGKEWAESSANAYERTLNDRMSRIEPTGLNTTSALTTAQGSGLSNTVTGRGVAKADKAAEKERKKAEETAAKNKKALEERMLEYTIIRLRAEESALKRSGAIYKEIADDELNGYEDRLFNLQAYLRARQSEIDKNQEIQLKENAKALIEANELERQGRSEEAKVVRDIVLKQNEELQNEVNDQKARLIKEGNSSLSSIYKSDAQNQLNEVYSALEKSSQDQLTALANQYSEGLINSREYAKGREDIARKLATDLIQSEIDVTQSAIDLAKAKGINVTDQEKALADLKKKLSKETAEQQITDLERVAEREKELNELKIEAAQELADLTFDILSSVMDRDLQKIELDQENLTKRTEAEKEAINNSTLAEEEKASRIIALERKSAAENEKLENKKAQIKLKQAKLDRAQNILGIVGATALGIMRAFADLGPLAGIPFAAIIGGLGAAQLISVLAQPLPQFYKGTNNSPEGFAKVGERGSELMIEPNGNMSLTPSSETITYLKKGTKILTHEQTKKALAKKSLSGFEKKQQNQIDLNSWILANERSSDKIVKAVKSSKYHGTVITKKGWSNEQIKSNKFQEYLRNNGL